MRSPQFNIPEFTSLDATFIETLERVSKQIRVVLDDVMNSVDVSWLKDLPKHEDRIRDYCAANGWYLPLLGFTLPQIKFLADLIAKGQKAEVEDFLCDFAKSCCDYTFTQAQKYWPHRQNILQDAFEAHSQRKYTLSIPVLLAQADGIFFELIYKPEVFPDHKGHRQVSLYGYTDAKQPKSGKAVDELLKSITQGLGQLPISSMVRLSIELLRIPSAFSNSTTLDSHTQKLHWKGPINRHAILHGIDVKYPTEENSLRAIMLISYLADLKEILERIYKNSDEYKRLLKKLTFSPPRTKSTASSINSTA